MSPRTTQPTRPSPDGFARLLALLVVALVALAACAKQVVTDQLSPTDSFAPTVGLVEPLACVDTTCPAPFTSCPGVPGVCTTNLDSDISNCGACGAACPESTSLNGTFVCSGGKCKLGCQAFYADCNNLVADGCETETYEDDNNCGGCGVVCPSDKPCWRGACGCPNGLTRCGNDCKNLQSDQLNCGACGEICKEPASAADPRWKCGPSVTPPNTTWTCGNGECTLNCKPQFGDCNNNFCGDGCEIDFRNDPNNCGSCGNACGPGQACEGGRCLCPSGTTRCGDECVDIKSDPGHCGFCYSRCPGPSRARPGRPVTGGPSCEDGVCKYVCKPGYADCDGQVSNGCEVDLSTDQANCGACGTACRAGEGQPCVGGKCLTKACEPPRAPR